MKRPNCQPILRNQQGAAALWLTTTLVMLLGIATLVVDGGMLKVTKNELQITADLAALAASVELPDEAAVKATAVAYSNKQVLPTATGTLLAANDVIIGNWDVDTKTFLAGGVPPNAVQVTTKRTAANGNAVDFTFAPLNGILSGDVQATSVAFREATGIGTRFLCDDEMFDKDVTSIEDLASANGDDPEDYVTDNNNDWFVDIPPGSVIDVPTGQVGDAGLFDIAHNEFPFGPNSSPSHTDFLNYNEDGTWREGLISKIDLDPLTGVDAVEDPALYASFVNPDFVQVCPLYKSDVSDLGNNEVNALGERRGLLAFKILAVGPDPSGSDLPNLTIEIADPSTINLADIEAALPGQGAGRPRMVK